jgi:hypothetical protein
MNRNIRGFVSSLLAAICPSALGIGVAGADPVSMFTNWMGYGRQMQLSPDGTGTLTLADGASTVDDSVVTWTGDPRKSITITLTSLTKRLGSGTSSQPRCETPTATPFSTRSRSARNPTPPSRCAPWPTGVLLRAV